MCVDYLDVLVLIGYSEPGADQIAKHIIDSELRGYSAAGFARLLAIRDRLGGKSPIEHIEVTNETPIIAHLDGHDTFGYLVAQKAMEMFINKAKQLGIAIVGASNT